jgi:hypothetical protein
VASSECNGENTAAEYLKAHATEEVGLQWTSRMVEVRVKQS